MVVGKDLDFEQYDFKEEKNSFLGTELSLGFFPGTRCSYSMSGPIHIPNKTFHEYSEAILCTIHYEPLLSDQRFQSSRYRTQTLICRPT
jgi:hypothetical protein